MYSASSNLVLATTRRPRLLRDKVRSNVVVYGPYTRKDGRKHVVIWDRVKTKTVSYPKWLMEQSLGRILGLAETVDHINRDFTDDRRRNLQILPRIDHSKIDAPMSVPVVMPCVYCGKPATQNRSHYNHNRRQGKAGPFCSRTCSGKYGADRQKRKVRLPVMEQVPLKRVYKKK